MTNRRLSWVFLIASLLLTITACWQARRQWMVLTQWKPATGILVRREVPRNHDSDGYLYFQMKGTFQYEVDGKQWESATLSQFGSRDFGWIAPRTLAYEQGSQHPLRYDPARPDVFEFGAGYNMIYFATPLRYLLAAALCLLTGLLLRRFGHAPKRCLLCNRAVLSYYHYCPDCGESISTA